MVFTKRRQAVEIASKSCPEAVSNQRLTTHVDGHSRFSMENEITTTQQTDQVPMLGADNDARLIDLWLHGRSAATQRGYRAEANRFVAHVTTPLHQVTLAALQGYADALDA